MHFVDECLGRLLPAEIKDKIVRKENTFRTEDAETQHTSAKPVISKFLHIYFG